ncbi:hypothetical protein NDN16_05190 [Aureimonas altamirensis]|uniref:hypothetical protein n=1 Tax=Aureimonas altamirensis TaxID=370622 RepID=UPI0020367F21|nr:hypothetical protein [Aureimonas altamirensis]MCM2503071.1 hypothetical protein [Aureimonas altamirensis]
MTEEGKASASRLDERTKGLVDQIDRLTEVEANRVQYIETSADAIRKRDEKEIAGIRKDMDTVYLRKDKFSPIEKIVYGLVLITLFSVAGALVTMVINSPR